MKTIRPFFQLSSACLMVLLPKCSICLAAYLNIFSLFGLSLSGYSSWILPILTLVVMCSLFISFLKARKLHDYRAFGILFTGSALLLTSKIWFTIPLLGWFGLSMTLIATVVQLLQSRKVCDQDILSI